MSITYPNGARVGVCLTFDFDAESLWLAEDPKNRERLATMSLGHYGAKVGVPKILELLRSEGLRCTFFTPGWTVDHHTDKVAMIVKDGHELAYHGYAHHTPNPDNPAQIVDELDRGIDAMKRHFGVTPVGCRPPNSESCHFLLEQLVERGFIYNSCFKDDVHVYRHTLRDGRPGPVELPEQPSLEDWGYGMSHIGAPKPMFPSEHVLSIYKDEFRMLREWGGIFMLVMHPQVTGRPMRLAILRDFVAFTRQFDDVWYGTGREFAELYLEQHAAPTAGKATIGAR